MSKDFWKSKNVLVTGGTGFIGSWLIETLMQAGAKVTALVERNSPFGIDAIKHLANDIELVYGDIRDSQLVANVVEAKDVVFHLASITQVLYAIKNPEETVTVNVGGTLNILEGIRGNGGEQFLVYASTDKVYGEPKYVPIDEEHPLIGKSPYDASKIAADRLVYAYHATYGLRCSIVRWSNTYGGRDANILRAVPDFVMSVLNGNPPVIRGDGKHIRDYMYITDAVEGIISAAENNELSNGEAFNLGTEKPTSVEDLTRLIIRVSGNDDKLEPIISGKPTRGEIAVQYLSSKKAREVLGWKPTVDLEWGLNATIEWYQENMWWKSVMDRVVDFYGIEPRF